MIKRGYVHSGIPSLCIKLSAVFNINVISELQITKKEELTKEKLTSCFMFI